jgi:cytochrome c peroxidase
MRLRSRRTTRKPEKIALGKTLFFDTRLSADNSTSCATCHKPDLGFTDQLATSKGIRDQHWSAQRHDHLECDVQRHPILERACPSPRRPGI